tara:strand:+ start:4199 stop:4672 length:474 start_codon:yes stop_codon:yes gene_type:complete
MSYSKVNKNPKFYFMEKKKNKVEKPKDSLPKGMTKKKFKDKYAKVVWCDYYDCIHNEAPEGMSRKVGTIIGNPNYEPIGTKDESFKGVCNKEEIGIRFKVIKTSSGAKHKVPECFNATSNKTGHMDFSKLLQPDGSPFGGNIESGNADTGYSNVGYL